ncbi:MAG TPA: chromosome partitioning protein [Gammaproteobacteria bacterium]|nr:chromosome partitioning protein [Gammaproteobacteria bacterium]
MRSIMLLNAKGGCGKSTLASNLASYYAAEGKKVALVDFDPQKSSLEWLAVRSADDWEILGIDGTVKELKIPRNLDVVIYDVPAGISGKDLTAMVKRAQTIIIPVLPSPIDIRAASHFIRDLLLVGKVSRKQTKIAVVANRVRENTLVFHKLEKFLKSLKIPFVATLRDTQNYIRAEERGLGIFELAPSLVAHDVEQWEPLLKWLRSKRSMPQA